MQRAVEWRWNRMQRPYQGPLTNCMQPSTAALARAAHELHARKACPQLAAPLSHDVRAGCERDARATRPAVHTQGAACVPWIAVPHTTLPRKSVQEACNASSLARQLRLATQAPTHLCVMRKTRVGGSVWKARIALPRAAASQGGPARGEAGQRGCYGSQGNLALQPAHPQASPLGSCSQLRCRRQCGPTVLPGLAHAGPVLQHPPELPPPIKSRLCSPMSGSIFLIARRQSGYSLKTMTWFWGRGGSSSEHSWECKRTDAGSGQPGRSLGMTICGGQVSCTQRPGFEALLNPFYAAPQQQPSPSCMLASSRSARCAHCAANLANNPSRRPPASPHLLILIPVLQNLYHRLRLALVPAHREGAVAVF